MKFDATTSQHENRWPTVPVIVRLATRNLGKRESPIVRIYGLGLALGRMLVLQSPKDHYTLDRKSFPCADRY
jgi:alkylhydroperoxidase family enzyme